MTAKAVTYLYHSLHFSGLFFVFWRYFSSHSGGIYPANNAEKAKKRPFLFEKTSFLFLKNVLSVLKNVLSILVKGIFLFGTTYIPFWRNVYSFSYFKLFCISLKSIPERKTTFRVPDLVYLYRWKLIKYFLCRGIRNVPFFFSYVTNGWLFMFVRWCQKK